MYTINKRLIFCFCFMFFSFFSVFNYGNASEIRCSHIDYSYYFSGFRYFKLGLNDMPYIAHPLMSTAQRRTDLAEPGDYIRSPGWEPFPVDSTDVEFIKNDVKAYLSNDYYDDKITNCIMNFRDELHFNRTEFYFDFFSNDTLFIISGIKNYFTHIIVFTEFNSKQNLINKAAHFFKLPAIDAKNVHYDEYEYPYPDDIDYIYEYTDVSNEFKLFGYPVKQATHITGKETVIKRFTVIDLTIYAKGQ